MTSLTRQFFFRALTPKGGKAFGVRSAEDESRLAEDLRREQMLLLAAWPLPGRPQPVPLLGLKDEAALNDQLAVLLNRGVPLVEALEVASSVVSEACRARVNRLRELVAAGDSFARACEKVGGFDAVTTAVYRSAERSGDLAGAAQRIAKAARRRLKVRGKAVTVLIYPAVVLVLSMTIFAGILVFIVPMIAPQVRQLGGRVNAFSSFIFALGEGLRANIGLAFIALGLLVVVVFVSRERLGAWLGAVARRLPAVASLLITVEMARFFSVMGAMTRSGVPLADALSTAGGVISNPALREELGSLQRGLVEGGSWRSLVERVVTLPLATRRLLVAAERGGDLDAAFDNLAEDLADDVDTRSTRLLSFLELGSILLIFALIAPLIVAVALPLLTARIGEP
ncbi:MAG TPA: hypothetical protein DEB06_09785 [Phycisphaerales bacterium]|nr:hypothetical protein [Phycisphaerales bacterium]